MRRAGRGSARRVVPSLLVGVFVLGMPACHGDDPPGDLTPSRITPTRTEPPTPVAIGTADVAAWAAVWKDAFQEFANDLSDVIQSARNRDFASLRAALAKIPGDAHEAVRKIDEAGAAPPGLDDEVRRLRGLVDQAAAASNRLGGDCLSNPGLPCAADVATILSVAGQIMDALKPFGVGIDFHIQL
jgi:hypothetical protein